MASNVRTCLDPRMGRKRRFQGSRGTGESDDWKRFSWRGIGLDVPVSWELGAVHGDDRSGYFRLDDSFYTRVEAKWHNQTGGRPSLERIQEQYMAQLRGKGRHRKNVELIEGPVCRQVDEQGSETCRFRWAAETEGSCLVRFCSACQRVLLIQVLSRAGMGGARLARRVLDSARDHSEDQQCHWAVYDLAFHVPISFSLSSHQLQSGLLEFLFVDRDAILGVRRWSMADIMLKRGDLDLWLKKEYSELLRDSQWEKSVLAREGDEGILVEGSYESKSARLVWPLLAMVPFGLGRRLPVNLCASVAAQIWHCPSSNRILGVHLRDPDGRLEAFHEVAASLSCHRTFLEGNTLVEDGFRKTAIDGQEGHLSVRSSQESDGGMAKE